MHTHIKTLIDRPGVSVSDRFSAMLNVFSTQALSDLLSPHLKKVFDYSPYWIELSELQLTAFIHYIDHFRQIETVSSSILGQFGDYDGLVSLLDALPNNSLRIHLDAYLKSIQGEMDASKAKSSHQYLFMSMTLSVKIIMEQMNDSKLAEDRMVTPKPGSLIAEERGFNVVRGKSGTNHICYPEGNVAVVIMHDVRENHFLMVERYNPITGLYMLEFPRIRSASAGTMETAVNTDLRELTGLPFRNLERIGKVMPESHVLEGECEVFYGNFNLEENHEPQTVLVRSLKRMTEEGLYQAAYEDRLECGVTLSAISVWRAFDQVRKKRLANSKRVRNKDD